MTIRHGLAVITVLGVGILATACEREQEAVGVERTRTGAQQGTETLAPSATNPVNVPQARKDLIAARCAHEERCGKVGADKKYASRDLCMNEVSNKIEGFLHADRCKKGADATRLQQCVAAINAHSCDKSLDDLGDVEACREKTLCVSD